MKKKLLIVLGLVVLILGVLFLTGCAAGVNPAIDMPDLEGNTAGFWSGLWHGIISPVTFIISIFNDNVNIYEVFNTGNWYDFGFMIGVSFIFGSVLGGANKARKRY